MLRSQSCKDIFKTADADGSKEIDADEFYDFLCEALHDETMAPAGGPEVLAEVEEPKIKAKPQTKLGKTVQLQTVYKVADRRRPIPHDTLLDLIHWELDETFRQSLTMLKLASRTPPPGAVGIKGDMIFEIEVSEKNQVGVLDTGRELEQPFQRSGGCVSSC